MTCFLAFQTRQPRWIERRLDELLDYLPLPSAFPSLWHSHCGTRGIVRFDWSEKASPRSHLIQGRPAVELSDCEAINRLRTTSGSFLYVSAAEKLYAYRSWAGDNAVYWRATSEGIFISNRVSLLLAIQEAPINLEAAVDLVGQGYIQDEDTLFQGISRLGPGCAVLGPDNVDRPNLASFFSPLSVEHCIAELPAIANKVADQLARVSEPLVLPLSGGKDSRCIAAMLYATRSLNKLHDCYTRGSLYFPDVAAATDLARVLGIKTHRVARPQTFPPAPSYAATVVKTLVATEGNLSLFNRASISAKKTISLDGHENHLKGTYFDSAPYEGLDEIIDHFSNCKPLDPHDVLSLSGKEVAKRRLQNILVDQVARGVPEAKLPQAFMWLVRNHAWVGTMAQAGNIAGEALNPLLDDQLLKFGMGLPLPDRKSEVLPFLLMTSLSDRPIWDVPFANDTWPADLIAVLSRAGWRGPLPQRTPPFRSHAAFPAGANPFVSNYNVELARGLRPFVRGILGHHKLNIFDPDKIATRLHDGAAISSGRLITELGLATIAIFLEFNRDFFRLSAHDSIVARLNLWSAPTTMDKPAAYEELLLAHERSIAELCSQLRSLPSSDTAPPARKWRHIEIHNRLDRAVEYRLTLNGNPHAPKLIEANEKFSYGVLETGRVSIAAKGCKPIELQVVATRDTYDAPLMAE
jgi:hypothetical protein